MAKNQEEKVVEVDVVPEAPKVDKPHSKDEAPKTAPLADWEVEKRWR